jgi:hypothetical protein
MFKKLITAAGFFAVLAVLIAGCSKQENELPAPSVLYSAVESAAELSDMIEFSSDELLDLTGISVGQYTEAVAYQTGLGMLPNEVIIVRAIDGENAADIETKLKKRLDYKKKSSEVYLTENLPIIEKGVVRRDGLTVALIVAVDVDSAIKAYENAK